MIMIGAQPVEVTKQPPTGCKCGHEKSKESGANFRLTAAREG